LFRSGIKSSRQPADKGASRALPERAMAIDFSSVHNHYERPVFDAVTRLAPGYPYLDEAALPDVACVALNRLGARYIRHSVDLSFYLTEKERLGMEQTISEAVAFAFEFVQARIAMRARR
jgi:hypothetical protein